MSPKRRMSQRCCSSGTQFHDAVSIAGSSASSSAIGRRPGQSKIGNFPCEDRDHAKTAPKTGTKTGTGRRPGQSKIGNFLQALGHFSDAAEAGEGGCFIHDHRPRHPRSARISGYLPLRVALRSARLAVRNGPRDWAFFRASAPVGRRPHP